MADDDLDLQDDPLDDDESELVDDGNEDTVANKEDDSEAISAEDILAAATSQSSLAARNKVRESMQSDIDAFLARGGQIQQVEDNVMADPPKKPTSNYGSRPI